MMRAQGYISHESLRPHYAATIGGFNGHFSGSYIKPDCFIVPDDRILPSVALEVGYRESYNQLKADADLLLEGCQGNIRAVIIVKLSVLGLEDTKCESGFVEVHEYDAASGAGKMRGRREILYPIPEDHAQQCITLQWEDIVRDNMDMLLLRPAPPSPPPLMLDDLRKCVDVGVKRHDIAREISGLK
ncbi:hypothetical protein ASPBRDRAFT_197336 [Aspergillus brasiliensis CBS 101740]|uniref:Uncharacterized protein n=1 Tax=Aspergillus brasiliensis (strain CBS 101740 / IMI 381727 / IBT 21946) TaxID=767769 RepID=A0A1L9UG42_ASPBC|nr:hypothetical protein ASPBRDRAFT_197336 [Aspergillus brasiliensis CBS 101740]